MEAFIQYPNSPDPILTQDTIKGTKLESDNLTNTGLGLPNPSDLRDIRKGGIYKPPKKARDLYELSSPDAQCNNTIGKPNPGQKCYICDIVMHNIENAGYKQQYINGKKTNIFEHTGRQCEHVLPILVMALICGLYSSKWEDYTNDYFKSLNSFEPKKKSEILKIAEEYKEWKQLCWRLSYQWSHTECNMIKNEFPYIDIKIDSNSENPIEVVGLEDGGRADKNLTNFFNIMLTYENSWTDMWRSWYNPIIWDEINGKHGGSSIRWIEAKKNNLKKHLGELIKVLNQGSGQKYFIYSIGILKGIIVRKLGHEKLLNAASIIADIFKNTGEIKSGSSKKRKNKNKKEKLKSGNPTDRGNIIGKIDELKKELIYEDIPAAIRLLGLDEKRLEEEIYDGMSIREALRYIEEPFDSKEYEIFIGNIILNYQETFLCEGYDPDLINSYLNNIKQTITKASSVLPSNSYEQKEILEMMVIENGLDLEFEEEKPYLVENGEDKDPIEIYSHNYWKYIADETIKKLGEMHYVEAPTGWIKWASDRLRSSSKKKKTRKKKTKRKKYKKTRQKNKKKKKTKRKKKTKKKTKHKKS